MLPSVVNEKSYSQPSTSIPRNPAESKGIMTTENIDAASSTRVRADDAKAKLLSCIDEGLSEMGKDVARVVHWYLQSSCDLSEEDEILKPKLFVEGLRSLFGRGSWIIEQNIALSIRKSFGPLPEEEYYGTGLALEIVIHEAMHKAAF
jgi:hypothetical protein